MLFLTWAAFAAYCRIRFNSLLRNHRASSEIGGLANAYQRLIFRVTVIAILLFALDIYLFHLKFWLQQIPGFKTFSVIEGVVALAVFIFYLETLWFFAYPAYKAAFKTRIQRKTFLISNLRMNAPIVFPWVLLTGVHNLLSLTSWMSLDRFFGSEGGQLIFFATFLIVLMVFMPLLLQVWWGCTPFKANEKVSVLEKFLQDRGFRYRSMLRWPIFEGRMLTAGIMGIIPRYRYIMVTDALMEILSTEELKAVLAHEMGHIKHKHFWYYMFFFIGYLVILYGLVEYLNIFLATNPFFRKILDSGDAQGASLFYLTLSLPILLTMVAYFRFLMGFFMRQFERQADLFSAVTMNGPRPVIASLEKIAFLSGKIRDLPSWHHFSIKERVACLWRTLEDRGLIRRHNRLIITVFAIYLAALAGLGYVLYFSPFWDRVFYDRMSRVVDQKVQEDPQNPALLNKLGKIYYNMGRYRDAMHTFRKTLHLDPNQAEVLNNLAWLLVTAPDEEVLDPIAALPLAERAVEIERSPVFLDTLAEVYYANGRTADALAAIDEAIALDPGGRSYYEEQRKKFLAGAHP
jgi:Zn-dependent protease with chaperone function